MYSFTVIAIASLVIPVRLALGLPSSLSSRQVTSTSKAGLAWPLNGNIVDIAQFQKTSKVSWYYTWSASPVDTKLEFVPMLWGPQQASQFSSTISATISKLGVKAVLGMNEPQVAGQANITPEVGAQLWRTYLEPLRAQGVRLGSPAPSNAASGKTWLKSFLNVCAGCTVDFIAVHYYGTDATDFINYISDIHSTFQRPVWVTEWGCQDFNGANGCTADKVALFLSQTQTFLDNSAFVERYAWFGALRGGTPDALLDSQGILNALGKQYIGAAA